MVVTRLSNGHLTNINVGRQTILYSAKTQKDILDMANF